MFGKFIFFRQVLTQQLLIIIGVSMAAKIGNYSQYIKDYNLCGLSRNTLRDGSSDCFEYHKDFDSNLKSNRTARTLESPWMVYFKQFEADNDPGCGGALISNKWVLTAGHCIKNTEKQLVYIHQDKMGGNHIESEVLYIHPKFKSDKSFDIGLIKLKQSFHTNTGRNYNASTICLPPKDLQIKYRSFALVSGYGPYLDKGRMTSRLEIGTLSIAEIRKPFKSVTVLSHKEIFGSVRTCVGDSGSPVWIYHMGRAVQVGIVKDIDAFHPGIMDRDGCGKEGTLTFVPHSIDWILETMKN